MTGHIEIAQRKRPNTYAIKVPPDGLSDAQRAQVASRFAQHEYNTRIKDTLGRRLMSVFGLFYQPKKD